MKFHLIQLEQWSWKDLKELDPVAYVRFASVYRNFREEKDFVQFVDRIDVFKKDNYKSLDKKIMNFAINLAENNKYLTGTNPSVGCVIVKKIRYCHLQLLIMEVDHTQKILL